MAGYNRRASQHRSRSRSRSRRRLRKTRRTGHSRTRRRSTRPKAQLGTQQGPPGIKRRSPKRLRRHEEEEEPDVLEDVGGLSEPADDFEV